MYEEGLNLLPCPHCGQPATLWAVDMSGGVYVFCDNCGMRGPVTEEMTEHAAIAAWNALPRHSDIERVERERDWLADRLGNLNEESSYSELCPDKFATETVCKQRIKCNTCWLQAAKEATSCQK